MWKRLAANYDWESFFTMFGSQEYDSKMQRKRKRSEKEKLNFKNILKVPKDKKYPLKRIPQYQELAYLYDKWYDLLMPYHLKNHIEYNI